MCIRTQNIPGQVCYICTCDSNNYVRGMFQRLDHDDYPTAEEIRYLLYSDARFQSQDIFPCLHARYDLLMLATLLIMYFW